jgi:hypothetical protein
MPHSKAGRQTSRDREILVIISFNSRDDDNKYPSHAPSLPSHNFSHFKKETFTD